jgi:hypothetical protein
MTTEPASFRAELRGESHWQELRLWDDELRVRARARGLSRDPRTPTNHGVGARTAPIAFLALPQQHAPGHVRPRPSHLSLLFWAASLVPARGETWATAPRRSLT